MRGGREEGRRGRSGGGEKWSRSMDVAKHFSYCICHLNRI